MAEKLTEIPRPKVSSYKPSRKIYLVATMFGFQGAPKDLQSKLETYWNDVRNQIENLEQSLTKITQVFMVIVQLGCLMVKLSLIKLLKRPTLFSRITIF